MFLDPDGLFFSLSKALTVKSGKCSCYIRFWVLFSSKEVTPLAHSEGGNLNKRRKAGSRDHLRDGKEHRANFPIVVLEDEVSSDCKLLSLEPDWIFANIFRMTNFANPVLNVKWYLA